MISVYVGTEMDWKGIFGEMQIFVGLMGDVSSLKGLLLTYNYRFLKFPSLRSFRFFIIAI